MTGARRVTFHPSTPRTLAGAASILASRDATGPRCPEARAHAAPRSRSNAASWTTDPSPSSPARREHAPHMSVRGVHPAQEHWMNFQVSCPYFMLCTIMSSHDESHRCCTISNQERSVEPSHVPCHGAPRTCRYPRPTSPTSRLRCLRRGAARDLPLDRRRLSRHLVAPSRPSRHVAQRGTQRLGRRPVQYRL